MAATPEQARSPIQDCVHHFRSPGENLYAVADAARDRELVFAARDEFGLELRTLFVGDLAPHLEHVAPHLIAFPPETGFLERWAEHLGRSAGILLLSAAPANEIWTHLRRMFVITDEADQEFSFRYYDPRVLRAYLPTCTADEAREFFGPIRRVLVESERPDVMLAFGPDETGVQMRERSLKTSGPAASTGGAAR